MSFLKKTVRRTNSLSQCVCVWAFVSQFASSFRDEKHRVTRILNFILDARKLLLVIFFFFFSSCSIFGITVLIWHKINRQVYVSSCGFFWVCVSFFFFFWPYDVTNTKRQSLFCLRIALKPTYTLFWLLIFFDLVLNY